MCWKSMWMCILSVVALAFLGATGAAPLSQMKHITLHVQSEVLDGHKIVITLEPLDNKSKEGLPVEFQEPFNVTLSKLGKSVQTGKPQEEETLEPDAGGNDDEKIKSETPAATTTEATNATTAEGTNATTTTTTEEVVVTEIPSGEPDVQEFLVKLPDVKCPEGFKQDGQGTCRQLVFSGGSRGKSMDKVNSIPEA